MKSKIIGKPIQGLFISIKNVVYHQDFKISENEIFL